MTRFARLLPVAALAALPACQFLASEDEPVFCLAVVPPAVIVEIRDSLTGMPRAAQATGWAVTGTHRDSLRRRGTTSDGVLASRQAYGPAGRYDVTVEHAGYRTWTRRGVVVGTDECGVLPTTLTARLAPL